MEGKTKSCGNNDNHLACLEVLMQKKNTREQRERVCELLTLIPTCHRVGGRHEQALEFPDVGVCLGPSDKEPNRGRTCEQQVENYQGRSNPARHPCHLAEARAVTRLHVPTL